MEARPEAKQGDFVEAIVLNGGGKVQGVLMLRQINVCFVEVPRAGRVPCNFEQILLVIPDEQLTPEQILFRAQMRGKLNQGKKN